MAELDPYKQTITLSWKHWGEHLDKLKQARAEVEDYQSERAQVRAELADAEARFDRVTSALTDSQARLGKAETDLSKAEQACRNWKEAKDYWVVRHDKAEDHRRAMQEKLAKAQRERDDWKRRAQDATVTHLEGTGAVAKALESDIVHELQDKLAAAEKEFERQKGYWRKRAQQDVGQRIEANRRAEAEHQRAEKMLGKLRKTRARVKHLRSLIDSESS